jgi:ribonuclease R
LKLTAARIIALWQNDSAWQPTLSEVRTALDLRKAQTARVETLLGELVAQGLLVRQRRRYRLPPPATRSAHSSVKAAAAAQAPAPKRPAATAAAQNRPSSGPAAAQPQPSLPAGAAGTEAVGVFSAHPNGFGFVEMEGGGDSVFIPPRYIDGALDGDWVQVERVRPKGKARPFGRVVAVLRRQRSRVRGHLQIEDGQVWLEPLNPKIPMVFLIDGEAPRSLRDQSLVEVELVHLPEGPDEAPEGRIVRQIAAGDAPEEVVLHILADTGLSADFSPETAAEMARLPAIEAGKRSSRRIDLRSLPFVTIDGEDARDFDDAVCLEALPNGNWRLLVSIADVAEYVQPGSTVDRDAYAKGTSVYFPTQVFPMLPEVLSNDLCSLKPRTPRHTLTCEIELTPDGERKGYRLYESLIESKARLTYGQVRQFFETGKRGAIAPDLAAMLDRMRTLAARLREKRNLRGALDFTFPEYRFQLDERGFPRNIFAVFPNEATRLIEQFMVEANETVAWHCAQENIPLLYRVHEPPPEDQIPALLITLWNFGLKVKEHEPRQPGGLKRLLERVQNDPKRQQIELAILKSMSQAQYRERNEGHFALAATHYAHFTSPIRRYPDLLLHRGLKAWLGRRRPPALPLHAGLHLSVCERTAADAEQRVIRLYKVLYMEPRLGETFPATVSGVNERGLFLGLRDHPVDGLLPLDRIPGPRRRVDRQRNLLLAGGKKPVGLGDQVTVLLARTDRLAQQLEFAFVAWGWAAGDGRESPAPTRRKRSGPA